MIKSLFINGSKYLRRSTEGCDCGFILNLADVDEGITAVFTPTVKKKGGGGGVVLRHGAWCVNLSQNNVRLINSSSCEWSRWRSRSLLPCQQSCQGSGIEETNKCFPAVVSINLFTISLQWTKRWHVHQVCCHSCGMVTYNWVHHHCLCCLAGTLGVTWSSLLRQDLFNIKIN